MKFGELYIIFFVIDDCILRDAGCHKMCPCFPPWTEFNIKERALRYSVETFSGSEVHPLFLLAFDATVSPWCLLSSRLAFQITLEEDGNAEMLYTYHIFIDLWTIYILEVSHSLR